MRQSCQIAVFALSFLAIVLAPALAHEFRLGDIEIVHPWARATPPNAAAGAGYMVIRNHGDTPDRLVSATAAFATPQLHETTMDGNVTRMRHLADGIVIPSGGEVAFEPGANHVMFMGLAAPFAEGDRLTVTLTFENAGAVEVEFVVQKSAGATSQDDHSGHGAMN